VGNVSGLYRSSVNYFQLMGVFKSKVAISWQRMNSSSMNGNPEGHVSISVLTEMVLSLYKRVPDKTKWLPSNSFLLIDTDDKENPDKVDFMRGP